MIQFLAEDTAMKFAKLFLAAAATLFSVHAGAASVTHTFNSGDPALASEVNQNFQDLVDAINAGGGGTTFGGEYFLQPSASGLKTERNVIVLRGLSDDGGTPGDSSDDSFRYQVRVYFENTEGVSVDTDSGTVTPNEVWIFGLVFDQAGNPTSVGYAGEYVTALPDQSTSNDPSGAFDQALGSEINEDADSDGTFENENAFGYVQTRSSNPLANAQLVHSIEMYRDGNKILTANSFSSVLSQFSGSVEIGAPLNQTYNNVVLETKFGYTGNGGNRVRIRAQNVGLVQQYNDTTFDDPVFNNQQQMNAIYTRIDGAVNGSLANTPFDPSSGDPAIQNRWFTP